MAAITKIWQALLGMVTEVGTTVGGFLWDYGPDLIMILVILTLAFIVGMLKDHK